MNQQDFINKIINAYIVAQNFIGNNMGGKIQRCRSHSVSSVAEDILASYVYDLVQNKGYSIYVDCPISIPAINGGKVKTYYPDIVVCNETENGCEIKYLIDLKMDVGWFRNNIGQKVADHDQVVQNLYSATNKIKMPICNKAISLSANLRYDILVVSSKNGGTNITSTNRTNLCSIYTLTVGDHPNKPQPKVYPHSEFSDFDNYCNSL